MLRPAFLLLLAAATPPIVRAKAPEGSPYCAPPGTRPLFVSPMGEPFRGEPGRPYPAAAWFAGADRDHDGAVDRAEFVADADRFFRTLDRDRDGRLVPDEVAAYERDVAPEIALYGPRGGEMMPPSRQASRSGESGYGGPMGAGRYSWLNVPEPVASADADVDRVIGEREFAAAAGRRFEALDPEGRGRLIVAELPRTPAQIAIEGPCKLRPKPKKQRDDADRAGEDGRGGRPRS